MTDTSSSLSAALKHHRAGDLERAEPIYRALLDAAPDHPDALHLWGLIAHQRGDHQAAHARIARAIAADPDVPRYHVNLGQVLRAMGRLEDAEASLHRALELKPGDPGIEFKLGSVAAELRLYNAAARSFRRVLDVDGRYPGARYNLALALLKARRFAEAEAAYRAALAVDAGNASAHAGLGVALRERKQYDAALASLDTALKIAPDHAEARARRVERTLVLFESGRAHEGAAAMHQALAGAPDHHARIAEAARRFHQDGAQERALALLDPLIAEGCDTPAVAAAFAAVAARVGRDDEAIDIVTRLLDRAASSAAADRRTLHFALGRLLDGQDAFDSAFGHFAAANRLYQAEYDRGAAEAFVDASIAAFTPEAMARMPRATADSELPVFIVGMPRSGTTLIEQILASHPAVHGGDELFAIPKAAESLAETCGSDTLYPGCVAQLGQARSTALARRYLDLIEGLGAGAARVIDKMPDNFKHLGLIALLLPRARIVHCVRDPLDCGLSNFFQEFAIEVLPYTAGLADIGHHYALYRRLMHHWRSVVDISVLDVEYEAVVRDQESMSRRLVGFCGLDWDEACLRFYENARPVRTWSFDQVRRPIYARSVGRAHNYLRHLGPLIEALDQGGAGLAPKAIAGDGPVAS